MKPLNAALLIISLIGVGIGVGFTIKEDHYGFYITQGFLLIGVVRAVIYGKIIESKSVKPLKEGDKL